jgi:hypothetical protein
VALATSQARIGVQPFTLSHNSDVLKLAWKDTNVVLFITTVHNSSETVIKPRRRPVSTSQASRETRKVLGPEIIKNLPIPVFIN